MIEGGAAVNATVLASGVVDKLFLYYAPTILGAGSVPFASEASFRGTDAALRLAALRLKNPHLHRFGEDVAVEGYLRDPYEE